MIYLLDYGEYTILTKDIALADEKYIIFMTEDFNLLYEFNLAEGEVMFG